MEEGEEEEDDDGNGGPSRAFLTTEVLESARRMTEVACRSIRADMVVYDRLCVDSSTTRNSKVAIRSVDDAHVVVTWCVISTDFDGYLSVHLIRRVTG